jgi:hypothetical protein
MACTQSNSCVGECRTASGGRVNGGSPGTCGPRPSPSVCQGALN